MDSALLDVRFLSGQYITFPRSPNWLLFQETSFIKFRRRSRTKMAHQYDWDKDDRNAEATLSPARDETTSSTTSGEEIIGLIDLNTGEPISSNSAMNAAAIIECIVGVLSITLMIGGGIYFAYKYTRGEGRHALVGLNRIYELITLLAAFRRR